MKLFSYLQVLVPELKPELAKVHLATQPSNGENPLNVYRRGEFEAWQAWQAKKNFSRPFVVALISLPEADRWVLAGVYRVHGVAKDATDGWRYQTEELQATVEVSGRAVVAHHRTGRNLCQFAHKIAGQLEIVEIRREAMTVPGFHGFDRASLTRTDLEIIVRRQAEGWRAALSSVKGVYCIADEGTGQLYVGKADGAKGIWQRWSDYVATGHGGNKLLVELLKSDPDASRRFRYTILEVMDTRSEPAEVDRREGYWKRALRSRSHGLNAN